MDDHERREAALKWMRKVRRPVSDVKVIIEHTNRNAHWVVWGQVEQGLSIPGPDEG